MIIRTIPLLMLLLFALPGCGLIYKQNIQQGNALEQDELDELYIGMNQKQVLFVLGTPSIKDPFNSDRWDYVQTFSRRGGEMIERKVTLHFDDGLLSQIEGKEDPFAATTSQGKASSGTIASFVKKPAATASGATSAASPQAASVQQAQEDVLGKKAQEDADQSDTEQARDFNKDRDVLDQTPKDNPTGPDIDG